MKIGSILYKEFLSHPNKPYIEHIKNMLDKDDTPLEREVKIFHDLAKLKNNFQDYIRGQKGKDKNHSLLSAYLFLLNSNSKDTKDTLFGFLSIVSHHGNIPNILTLKQDNTFVGKHCYDSKELRFIDEVVANAKQLSPDVPIYKQLNHSIELLKEKCDEYRQYLLGIGFSETFSYKDFVDFKKLYASLIYSDKYEAIFNQPKESHKKIPKTTLSEFINNLSFHESRNKFREKVLSNFDNNHKLFTITAPTGYGKTLTALEFALKFNKQKIIFALPFTSIIDQTYQIVKNIFNDDIDIFKIHHKSTINENIDEDRYSKIKFLMNSFSGEINITTHYQIIFALFGNSNKDNIKFNQFKNAVVIIDEVQAIPYQFRADFIKLCEIISKKMGTIFIFMSATMPIMNDNFKELSDLGYFNNQNRYILKWLHLEDNQNTLIKEIKKVAKTKHTLCVVNTIKKAQELYLKFKDDFECYCLNGYMTDIDKQRTIKTIKDRLKQNDKKVLLISTQSIEAGVDLDFEVGFREVAPISSIIQTAGRVNRNFSSNQGVVYIFDDICGYSDALYGDMQLISKNMFDLLKDKPIQESEILNLSDLYFKKIKNQLERFYIEKEIEKLEFETISNKIKNLMQDKINTKLIIIEPYSGFIKEIEDKIKLIKDNLQDKFKQKDQIEKIVKYILQYSVNVSINDIKSFGTRVEKVKFLNEIFYLPAGANEYSKEFGIRKYKDKIDENELFY